MPSFQLTDFIPIAVFRTKEEWEALGYKLRKDVKKPSAYKTGDKNGKYKKPIPVYTQKAIEKK